MPTIFETLNCWRSIIERGRTTSTYKMALASAIAQMVDSGTNHVNRRQLAELFFEIYMDRLRVDMPQLSDPNETTIVEKAIDGFKAGRLAREQAVRQIEQEGFRYVLEAFHTVPGQQMSVQFYTYNSTGLRLTDAAYQVFRSPEKDKLLREIDSRWSQIEETFARKRLGSNVSVWVAGTEAGRQAQYVWCRANASDGSIMGTGTSLNEFADGISEDLSRGQRVSLGIEAPLSVVVPRQPEQFHTWGTGVEKHRRVSEQSHRFRRIFGPRPSVFGLAETAWVMREIGDFTHGDTRPTFNWRRFVDGDNKANLFIWEASVSSTQKIPSHINRAQVAATSFFKLYPRLRPEMAEGDAVFSLGAAALMWAGFRLEEDALRSPCVVVRAGRH